MAVRKDDIIGCRTGGEEQKRDGAQTHLAQLLHFVAQLRAGHHRHVDIGDDEKRIFFRVVEVFIGFIAIAKGGKLIGNIQVPVRIFKKLLVVQIVFNENDLTLFVHGANLWIYAAGE